MYCINIYNFIPTFWFISNTVETDEDDVRVQQSHSQSETDSQSPTTDSQSPTTESQSPTTESQLFTSISDNMPSTLV